jgi:outer membrane protein assembly factor BamB
LEIKTKGKSTFAVLLVLLMLSSALMILTSSMEPANALSVNEQYEFTQVTGDPSHTYFTAGPAPNTPNLKWQSIVPGACTIPVAFNGMLFVSDYPGIYPPAGLVGSTYAIAASTGKIIWKNYGLTGDVCKIDDTYMLIGTTCVTIADGETVWAAPAGFSQGSGYISDLKMFVSGALAWKLSDPSKPPTVAWNNTEPKVDGAWSPFVYGNGVIVMKTTNNFLVGVNVTNGAVMWTNPATTTFLGYSPSYIDGVMVHGGIEGTLTGWNITTGEAMWTFNPGTFYNQFASGSAAAYGMVYMRNQDTYLYAVNATTGQLVWKYKGSGVAYEGRFSVADGKVYVQTGDAEYRDFETGVYGHDQFDCIDAYTGKLIWSLPIGNGAPFNLQCVAFGNLYIIPTQETVEEGQYYYTGYVGGEGLLNEVWCIGDTPQDWPMFLNDPAHTAVGYGPTNLALSWEFKTEAPIVSSPTLVNGVAYFGSLDRNIYAVDANSGVEIWKFPTAAQAKSSPAVVNGKLFTGADDGKVYCLDAGTGTKIWEANAGGFIDNSIGPIAAIPSVRCSPMVVGNNVYAGALDGNLYCFDANTGNTNWKVQTGGAILATPTIVDNVIYLTPNTKPYIGPGTLLELDANNGKVLLNVTIPYSNRSGGAGNYLITSPSVADGMVFVRTGLYTNFAINATTGETLWTYNATINAGTPGQNGGTNQMTAMLYKHGLVYFNDYYGITCLNATDGSKIWQTFLSREDLAQGITYSYGQIYVVTQAGSAYALNAQSGNKTSSYYIGTTLLSTPTPYNGSLYLGGMDWNLYCFKEAPPAQAAGPALPTVLTISVAPKFQTSGPVVLFEGMVAAQSVDTQAGVSVGVHLTAIDPNGNFQDIGTVASDDNGFFCTTWTPPVSGTYVVTASFEGDQYFLLSSAKTAFVVTDESVAIAAVSPTPTPVGTPPAVPTPVQSVSPSPSEAPQPATSAATPTLTYIAIGAAVIIVVAAAAVLILRRRK